MVDSTRATTARELDNPLFRELVRLDAGISGFNQDKEETPDQYRSRVQRFGSLYSKFGLTLINSPEYRGADDDDRRKLFDLLNDRSKRLVKEGREAAAPALLSPRALLDSLSKSKRDD